MITFTFLGVIFSGIVLVLVVYRIDYLERRIKKLEYERRNYKFIYKRMFYNT
jgi:hypothetical protein